MKTKRRKRRGDRCYIRRYDMVYPSIDKTPAHHEPAGYAIAVGELVPALQYAGRRSAPFYAFVDKPMQKGIHITGFPDASDIPGIIRNARQEHEQAEWDAAAPDARSGS